MVLHGRGVIGDAPQFLELLFFLLLRELNQGKGGIVSFAGHVRIVHAHDLGEEIDNVCDLREAVGRVDGEHYAEELEGDGHDVPPWDRGCEESVCAVHGRAADFQDECLAFFGVGQAHYAKPTVDGECEICFEEVDEVAGGFHGADFLQSGKQ